MKSIPNLFCIVAVLLAGAGVGSVHGITITHTDINNVPFFDASLGTLTSVKLFIEVGERTSILTVTNNDTIPVTATRNLSDSHTLLVDLGLPILQIDRSHSPMINVDPGQQGIATAVLPSEMDMLLFTNQTDLAKFIGNPNNNLPITAQNPFNVSITIDPPTANVNTSTSPFQSPVVSRSITYDYIEGVVAIPVPEPLTATLGMMSLTVFGYTTQRRRIG